MTYTPNPIDPEAWLSPKQTADLLRITNARVRQLSIEGRLPYVDTPNGRLYPRHEIERIAQQREEANASDPTERKPEE
jgi:predicted site-specific integrase-resolvase